MQSAAKVASYENFPSLDFSTWTDSSNIRKLLGSAAKKGEWFKGITRGECVGSIIGPCLEKIPNFPLATSLKLLREWIDA
jgi:hypothetical protein